MPVDVDKMLRKTVFAGKTLLFIVQRKAIIKPNTAVPANLTRLLFIFPSDLAIGLKLV